LRASGGGVGDLGTREGQEQEHESTDKFTYPCNNVSSDRGRNLLEENGAAMLTKLVGISKVDLLGRHTRENNVLGRLTIGMLELVMIKMASKVEDLPDEHVGGCCGRMMWR